MEQLIKTSSFGRINKRLVITSDSIYYHDKVLNLKSVSEIKYGLKSIIFYHYVIGCKYIIDIKSNDITLRVIFKSYFNSSKNYFNNLYDKILAEIWQQTSVRIIDEIYDKIMGGEEVNISKCRILKSGVYINNNFIKWNDLTYQKNYDRLIMSSISNGNIYTNLYYTETYNIIALCTLLDWIYKSDGLNTLLEN